MNWGNKTTKKNLKIFRNDDPNETSNVNGSNQKKKNGALLLHCQIQTSHFSITLVVWRDFTLLGLSHPLWFWFLTKMGNSDDFLFKRVLRNRGRQKTDEIKYYPPKTCQNFYVNAYLLPPIFELNLFLKSK